MGQCAPRRADGAADITRRRTASGVRAGVPPGGAARPRACMCTTKCGCARRSEAEAPAAEVAEEFRVHRTVQSLHPSSDFSQLCWEVYNRALKQQTGSAGHYISRA